MHTFNDYFDNIITEAVHKELQDIMDLDSEHHHKLGLITKKVRELSSRNEDSGLENGKPKKGSSRAVFFSKEPKEITLDNQKVKIPTATKISFAGSLDKYRKHGDELLGTMQNSQENDYAAQRMHGVFHHDSDTGHYHTNHEGVLAPLLESHKDSHWLEFSKVDKLKKSDFPKLTKTESHPKGIKFDDMYKSINSEYDEAHGHFPSHGHTEEHHQYILSHPLVKSVMDFTYNCDHHPADLHPANWGVLTHPTTGKKMPVICDYGCSTDISHEYNKRRTAMLHASNPHIGCWCNK